MLLIKLIIIHCVQSQITFRHYSLNMHHIAKRFEQKMKILKEGRHFSSMTSLFFMKVTKYKVQFELYAL